MPLISIIFRALIIAPIRALLDVIRWLFTTVFPFLGTLLGSFPLNVIFLISIAVIVIMWLFPDPIVWLMVLVWEISRFFFNIYLLAVNVIYTLFYNWSVPLWNELVDFGLLVWQMVNNGICEGMPPFAGVVECGKFGDWLLIIEIWITFTYEYLYIGMGFIALLAQLLATLLGNLDDFSFQKHNYCTMPACSDWGGMRINPDTGTIIKNPGLLGVNFKDNLDQEDVRTAQIISAILIFFIQWFLSEVLPFLVQLSAFIVDVAKLVIYYLWEVLELLLVAFSQVFISAYYIITRPLLAIISQPDLTIVFDPDFWRTNITAYMNKNNTIQEVLDAFVADYMFNITDLVQYRTIGIGRNETWQGFIRAYYWIHVSLQMVFELPLIFSQLADKVTCLFLHLFECLNLSFFCRYLFQAGELCIGLQKIATNDTLFSMTPDPWYYNYEDPSLFRISFLAACSQYGCNQTYCPDSAPQDCKLGVANTFFCIPSPGLEVTQDNFRCLDISFGGNQPVTGPIDPELCWYKAADGHIEFFDCQIKPYDPFYSSPISFPLSFYGGRVGVNFTYPFEEGCNITDVPGYNDSCRYCGILFPTEATGIFYFSREWFFRAGLEFLYVAIDQLSDLLIGVDLWAAIRELSTYMGEVCIDLNELVTGSGVCPCCGCPTVAGQFIKFFDDLIFKFFTCEGFPCNPAVNDCCTPPPGDPAPYTSLLYTIRDIIDSFDIFNVLPDLF